MSMCVKGVGVSSAYGFPLGIRTVRRVWYFCSSFNCMWLSAGDFLENTYLWRFNRFILVFRGIR